MPMFASADSHRDLSTGQLYHVEYVGIHVYTPAADSVLCSRVLESLQHGKGE